MLVVVVGRTESLFSDMASGAIITAGLSLALLPAGFRFHAAGNVASTAAKTDVVAPTLPAGCVLEACVGSSLATPLTGKAGKS